MSEPVPETIAWLIFFSPLAAFAGIALGGRRRPDLAGLLTIGAIGAAFLLSLWVCVEAIGRDGLPMGYAPHVLFDAGSLVVNVGIRLDGLTAVMLAVVTGVSLLVQIYSRGYLHGDSGGGRYYAFMALFTASMLGLILASNLLMLFVFWELVGLTSYLLIGFWFHRPAAAAAAKKAFLVTRAGDLGLLAALIMVWNQAGTFEISAIHTAFLEAVQAGIIAEGWLTAIALGLVAGAVGKSAQFPLHIWLPDAMEGPTPVSALVHSATMVAAGVYLLARFFPVLEASTEASHAIAWIGAGTALGAALLAVVQVDIKRVLAYSTISQLGYMMFALGVGGLAAAVFHLFTHAFFKALLFLGSGSVHHATNTFDMRRMGGLRRHMPITYLTFVIGTLSLAGVIPLAGFWSKDEILIDAWEHNRGVFALGLAAAGLTGFYMVRAIILTFHGDYRGGAPPEPGEHGSDPLHPHESPRSMAWPLLLLAVPAIGAGFLAFGGAFQTWVYGSLPQPHEGEFLWKTGIFAASTAVALAGIGGAVAVYQARVIDMARVREHALVRPLHTLLVNKFYMDLLVEEILVRGVFYRGGAYFMAVIDSEIIDGAVNGVAKGVGGVGRIGRLAQDGQVQTMGVALGMGAVIIWGAVVIFQG